MFFADKLPLGLTNERLAQICLLKFGVGRVTFSTDTGVDFLYISAPYKPTKE
jgi:hypothetical protein